MPVSVGFNEAKDGMALPLFALGIEAFDSVDERIGYCYYDFASLKLKFPLIHPCF
jgi:hypothetical protein